VLVLALGASCKKNQLNGSATISGRVMHHSKPIPFSRVFIKFDAREFPGADTTKYDAHVQSDANANYSIKVYKGDYFLYGVGYDPGIQRVVIGGIPVHIRNNETVNTDVPVTE